MVQFRAKEGLGEGSGAGIGLKRYSKDIMNET